MQIASEVCENLVTTSSNNYLRFFADTRKSMFNGVEGLPKDERESQFALPENLVLTASRGGKHDDLIDLHGWKEALVVYSEQEAIDKGLEINHDDTHAAFGEENFALLIHGTQPKGSMASQALSAIKKAAKGVV